MADPFATIPFKLATGGSGSPINLTGSPVQSGENPVVSQTTLFGVTQYGGDGNKATENLPTPNSLFGQTAGTVSNSTLGLAALAALAIIFVLKEAK